MDLEDIRTLKNSLRRQILERRKSLTLPEVQEKSRSAAKLLTAHPAYIHAKTILIYLPTRNETETRDIISTAWQEHKTVTIPVSLTKNKNLLLSRLDSFAHLKAGAYAILEPDENYLLPVEPGLIDLAILPGVAFDRRGFRLGYGAGYFDRFLPSLRPDCVRVALCYDFQVLETLPAEEHDLPVNLIITENRVIPAI